MKNLKNVNGVKALSKNEQKSINGGGIPVGEKIRIGICFNDDDCPEGYVCEFQEYVGKTCHRAFSL